MRKKSFPTEEIDDSGDGWDKNEAVVRRRGPKKKAETVLRGQVRLTHKDVWDSRLRAHMKYHKAAKHVIGEFREGAD